MMPTAPPSAESFLRKSPSKPTRMSRAKPPTSAKAPPMMGRFDEKPLLKVSWTAPNAESTPSRMREGSFKMPTMERSPSKLVAMSSTLGTSSTMALLKVLLPMAASNKAWKPPGLVSLKEPTGCSKPAKPTMRGKSMPMAPSST